MRGYSQGMKVLIAWADHYSTNLGVRALAAGAHELVHRVFGDAEVAFQSFGQGAGPVPLTERALLSERLPWRHSLSDWLSEFDLVIDMRAGDSFSDIYGPRRLIAMNEFARITKLSGTPLIMGPQTIGPFNTKLGMTLGRMGLGYADYVLVRDSASAIYATKMGRPVDAVSTDLVFGLPVPSINKTVDVALNVSGLLWRPSAHVNSDAYKGVIRTLCEELAQRGRQVTLFAHVLSSSDPDDDEPALAEVAEDLDFEVEFFVPADLESVREFVASAEVVIGSRMHACLNALSVGTPAVPLSYSRKFSPLLEDLGWPHCVDLREASDPTAAVLSLLDSSKPRNEVSAVVDRAQELLLNADRSIGMVVT